jgi:glycosyltransferase involved in cell wall biosynthesis
LVYLSLEKSSEIISASVLVKRKKTIVQFICYSPKVYSGFDRYNLILAKKLNNLGFETVLVYSDRIVNQALSNDLEETNIKTEFISSGNKLSIIFGVLRVIKKYKPLIVHAHFENIVQLSAALISRFYGSFYFATFHSLISKFDILEYRKNKGVLKSLLLRLYYRLLLLISVKVFCVSKAVEEQFINFAKSNSSKIVRLYLGIEIKNRKDTKGQIRRRLTLPSDIFLMCNVSAYEYIKGIDVLINALNHLKKVHPEQRFLCCHFGGLRDDNPKNKEYFESVRKKVIDLGLENEFIWMGQRNDIPEILAGFDIYIHPSRREGLPVSAMEAASNQLALLGSDVGGIPEIIKPDLNGYLFKSEDYESLSYYLNIMISSTELRLKMSRESLYMAMHDFNVDTQTDKLLNYYFQS